MEKILRLPAVKAATGKSRSGIYQGMADGTFPAPVALGARAVGWRESDLVAWIQSLRGKVVKPPVPVAVVAEPERGRIRRGVNGGAHEAKAGSISMGAGEPHRQ